MTNIPTLTQQDIIRWAGNEPYEYARDVLSAHEEAIFKPRRIGLTLHALCYDSLPFAYRVQVQLSAKGIVKASCSCSMSDEGRCEHVAGLLLAWLNQPESFVVYEEEPLESLLEGRSKAELIALVGQMVARSPELEILVSMPQPGEGEAIQPQVIRQQVVKGLWRDIRHDFTPSTPNPPQPQRLAQLVKMGDEYATIGEWQNALTVYEAVAREVLNEYYTLPYNDEQFFELVQHSTRALENSLTVIKDVRQREQVLRCLFDIYSWDVNYCAFHHYMLFDVNETILALCTAQEKEQVIGWVRSAAMTDEESKRYIFGHFLLEIEGHKLDEAGTHPSEASFISLCRQTGHNRELVDRLLSLGRVAEAEYEAQQAQDHELIWLANIFEHYGEGARIEQLIRKRAPQSQESRRLLEWLKKQAEERGDLPEALTLAKHLLWRWPSSDHYQEVKKLATTSSVSTSLVGDWESMRPNVMAHLAEAKEFGLLTLLTEIYLRENQIVQALETLPKAEGSWQYEDDNLPLRVAQAAEKSHPRQSIPLYEGEINNLITTIDSDWDLDWNGNDQARKELRYHRHATAASYLHRVRNMYNDLDDQAGWQQTINRIRQKHGPFGALNSELDKLGL